jgi:hypothetical protein
VELEKYLKKRRERQVAAHYEALGKLLVRDRYAEAVRLHKSPPIPVPPLLSDPWP